MSKGKIITISIFSFIVLLGIVLFSFVFCVRKQTVNFTSEMLISEQEILTTANIKNGNAAIKHKIPYLVFLNKEKATQNIETKFPNIKVIQIKTTSLIAVEFIVRERYGLYYIENNENYYVLDVDLKVLEITEIQPTHLTKIETPLNTNEDIKISQFLGTKNQQSISSNLFIAMYSAVLTTENNQARIDMANLIKSVNLDDSKLTITTREYVKLEIAKPNSELTNKINICFSAIDKLTDEQKNKTTIKILYNSDETEYKGYVNYDE